MQIMISCIKTQKNNQTILENYEGFKYYVRIEQLDDAKERMKLTVFMM